MCKQSEAISNFKETFNLNKNTKCDTGSETIAGPVLYCQQTIFSTSEDVEKSDLGSSKGGLEFDLTSSSGESEVKLDSAIGEPEGKRRFSKRRGRANVCGPYNISQHKCLGRHKRPSITFDFEFEFSRMERSWDTCHFKDEQPVIPTSGSLPTPAHSIRR